VVSRVQYLYSMIPITKRSAFSVAALVAVAACAPAPPAPPPAPVPAPVQAKPALPPANPALPPVPEVRGPLDIKVVYPAVGDVVPVKDSNFIFGSIGNGDAALTINGVATPVWPNGAFIGWLPLPARVPDSANAARQVAPYSIVAVVGGDTARLTYAVKVATAATAAVSPDTLIRFSEPLYATLGGTRPPAALRGTQSYKCFGAITSCVPSPTVPSDTDRVIIGRPTPTGTYKWFLFRGTSVSVTGTQGEMAQVRLDSGQTIWISGSDLTMPAPSSTPAIPAMPEIGAFSLKPDTEWIDLEIPASAPPEYLVEETDRGFNLTFYGSQLRDTVERTLVSNDPYLAAVKVGRESGRVVHSVALAGPPFGYLALYENGKFTLRLRRPPVVDSVSPLKGLTIAVDPGHPPVGATGPTGLWEPIAVLPVGFKVRDMLLAKGANVVMTRTAHEDVDLLVRPIVSRRNNAHAFVSIHLNALPDGVNPFVNNGTGTYWFHPQSRRLAESLLQALLPEMGLKDNGVHWANFAVMRGTWMPSALCEGAFLMLPDQEAAIRTEEYQSAYARGIVNGLERFFAAFARSH
jgi:N-acetylmuramoyl-L-alanine amidase